MGQGLVIARSNSCPGKEADHAPGYTTVERQPPRLGAGRDILLRHPALEPFLGRVLLAGGTRWLIVGFRFRSFSAHETIRVSGTSMARSRWQMTNGRWQMADDKWQMADGGW